MYIINNSKLIPKTTLNQMVSILCLQGRSCHLWNVLILSQFSPFVLPIKNNSI